MNKKAKKENNMNKNKKGKIYFFKKKIVTKTTTTLLFIAILIAAYIGINILVEKLNLKNIDLTKEKLYTISEESKTKLKDINKDVKIYTIGLNEYKQIFNKAEQYNRLNEKISCEQIEKSTDRPDLVNKYGMQNDMQVIIVESGDRSKLLSISDLYTYDSNSYEEIDLTEEALTNAIIDVTIEEKPQVCFLSGHNLYDTMQHMATIRAYIQNEANEVKDIDILSEGSIPESCDVLVITTLKEDITELERDEILKYINNGGKIMLLTDSSYKEVSYPNFQAVLDVYGVSIATKGVIFEQDSDKMIYQSPELIKPIINEGTEITKYISSSGGVCFIDSTKINVKPAEELSALNVEYTQLVTTGENAFYRTNFDTTTLAKTSSDEEAGNSVLGAMFEKKIDDQKTSKLVIYANNVFATDMEIPLNSQQSIPGIQFYNNKDLVLNSVSYLAERTDTITIRKNANTVIFTASDMETKVIQIVISLIPVLIVIVGIVVWQVRRRKR